MMTSADFEQRWKAACVEVQGKGSQPTGHAKQEGRLMRQAVVAKVVARGARKLEYNSTMWKMIRSEARDASETDDGRVMQSVQGNTISAFMGRREIVFPKQVEKPRLVQRRGADLAPPKHWTQEQIEEQEEMDLVLHSRAPGTWLSDTRWWQLFATYVQGRGVSTSDWRAESEGDRMVMVMMLSKMVVSMRKKYAYGTINMLVTAVTRASRDFGWASPQEDERFAAVMEGLID